jgi:hypothetical protein
MAVGIEIPIKTLPRAQTGAAGQALLRVGKPGPASTLTDRFAQKALMAEDEAHSITGLRTGQLPGAKDIRQMFIGVLDGGGMIHG